MTKETDVWSFGSRHFCYPHFAKFTSSSVDTNGLFLSVPDNIIKSVKTFVLTQKNINFANKIEDGDFLKFPNPQTIKTLYKINTTW